ncbi:MAG: DUF3307 domain-containing protein [Bacteroidales bacterium]|nr:DUF3307 domain-containing protein [Bacteroidales bacterium]
MIILVKLILAHLLGDFLLQPDSWVKAKKKKKLAAYQLYLHILIHFALIMLLVSDLTFWKWAVVLALVHLVIDVIKLYAIKEKTQRLYFFIDQGAHFLLIFGIWLVYQGNTFPLQNLQYENILLWITAVYALTTPTSMAIKSFISKWTPHTEDDNEDSLEEAGKYIGMLERLFVFGFVVSAHWEAIGFLLAAKSIFRFGDLKEAEDRKLTEYVLIGTLVSFGIAILIGVLYLKF